MGAQWRIIGFSRNLGVPESVRNDLSLRAMLGPPFNKPHGWLTFWFNKVIRLMPLDEPGMRHIIKLIQKYFVPCIDVIII
jgi:hypothetical protein